MVKFLIIPVIVVLEAACHQFFCVSWFLFDPLLAAAVIQAFFHGLDVREFVPYALWCGFWRDMSSMDLFGTSMISYLLTVLGVSFLARMLYRYNRMFVFPVAFVCQIFNNHVALALRFFLSGFPSVSYLYFLGRTLLQAAGTTLAAYPLLLLFKKCAPESTA